MFNPIRSFRNFISKRVMKEDTGFTCSVYDLKNGETVLDTHDIDEFLRFLEELNKREPNDNGADEEYEDCCCDFDCLCPDCTGCDGDMCECSVSLSEDDHEPFDDPDALCDIKVPVSVNFFGMPVRATLKLNLTAARGK